jgi:hypothetical protein
MPLCVLRGTLPHLDHGSTRGLLALGGTFAAVRSQNAFSRGFVSCCAGPHALARCETGTDKRER